MTFSKDVIDDVKDYLVAGIDAEILACETQYGVTIDRAVHFDVYNYMDNQFPFAVIYEQRTPYEMETISRDLKKYNMAFDIVDSRMDLEQLRANLYAYRDSVCELIENRNGKNLGGICVQAYVTEVLPAAVIREAGNYKGFTAVKFTVEII